MTELREQAHQQRKALKMRQQDVADGAGISLRAYQGFENGETEAPQPANLRAILRTLKMTEAQDETRADITREGWPLDVRVFVDMMGAFLSTMSEADRLAFIHDETRRIVGTRRV